MEQTPKQKAEYLVNNFRDRADDVVYKTIFSLTEIKDAIPENFDKQIKYWHEVFYEIIKINNKKNTK